MAKPSARLLGEAAGVGAPKEHKVLLGASGGLLGWPDGQGRRPLVCRVWPTGGPSQDAFALALRSEARHRLTCQPACVVVASWSPSQPLVQRIRDEGGTWSATGSRTAAARAGRDGARSSPPRGTPWDHAGGAESLWGARPPHGLRPPPRDLNGSRGTHAVPETARSGRRDQRRAEPTEPRGLASRWQALLEGHVTSQGRCTNP